MPFTQITARWNGFTGSPGWLRMKFLGELNATDAAAAALNWRSFLNSIVTYGPNGSVISIDSAAAIFATTGEQTGEVTIASVPSVIACTGSGSYAGGAGAVCNWVTDAFHLGRKVRGRTFLVPLTAGAFFTDGTLASAAQTAIQNAGNTFAGTTPQPVVFSKKDNGAGGVSTLITAIKSSTVPDRSALLRSRRD